MILKFQSVDNKKLHEVGSNCYMHTFDNIIAIHYRFIVKTEAQVKDIERDLPHVRLFMDKSKSLNDGVEQRFVKVEAERIDGKGLIFYSNITAYVCNDNGQTTEKLKIYQIDQTSKG